MAIAVLLSLIKDMQTLSWASCVGFISVVVIDIIIIAYAPSVIKVYTNAIDPPPLLCVFIIMMLTSYKPYSTSLFYTAMMNV